MELHLIQATPNIWKEQFGNCLLFLNLELNTISVKIGDQSKITYNYDRPLTILDIIDIKQRAIAAMEKLNVFRVEE